MVADKARAAEIGDFPFQAIGTIISDGVFKGKPVPRWADRQHAYNL